MAIYKAKSLKFNPDPFLLTPFYFLKDTDIYIAILKKLSLHVEKTIKKEEN